jgi:hypothetical protein
MFEELKIDHSYLVSAYHAGIIASLVLIARNMKPWLASKQEVFTTGECLAFYPKSCLQVYDWQKQ